MARITEGGRFLLFDVVYHEQLNKQRRALMFYLDLAMRLKRTLVLPRARLLRKRLPSEERTYHGFSPEAEYVRWGDLLDLSALRRGKLQAPAWQCHSSPAWPPAAGSPGSMAALRTRDEPLSRSGPYGRLHRGRESRLKPPMPRPFTRRRRLHPVLDLDEYLQQHGTLALGEHRIVPHGNVRRDCSATSLDFNGLAVRRPPCAQPQALCRPHPPAPARTRPHPLHLLHPAPARLPQGVQSESTRCDQGAQYQPRTFLAPAYASVKALSWQQCVDQTGPNVVLRLRPWVRFEQGVYDAAAAFVAKTFGTEPFVAIHWRRTDFLTARQTQPGVLQSPAELMRHARALMKQHGVTRVYLATDNTDGGEMARVNAGLQPTRLEPPAEAAESLRARAVHANVEIAICAMADYFLGTQTSSFSLAITEERQAVFGHAAATGAEMGLKDAVIERSARQDSQPHAAPTKFKDEL